jgi:signal transduction histidine kinase
MSNAVKFTQRGGRITVAAGARADGAWTLSVADTGIGMKPEEIPLALEPFRQLSSGHTRRYEGTGLGLPLALQLAELHGGSLEIASAPGKGTTVTLVLPASRVLRQVA